METRTLLCAVTLCVALASCAPIQPLDGLATSSQTCNGATCEIDVSVKGSDIVVVDYVIVGNHQTVNMIWRLPNDSPYTLKIEIIGGDGEFDCRSNGPRQFHCNNRHTVAKVYKYWVKLDGPNHLEKDPYIVND